MKTTKLITIGALALILGTQSGCSTASIPLGPAVVVGGAAWGIYDGYKTKQELKQIKGQLAANTQDIERLGYGWQVHHETLNRPAYMEASVSVQQPAPNWRNVIDSLPQGNGGVGL